ncbi:hypothetical protein CL629_03605 [bacterium]|nr:hypothetical protein [bacterium]|tara:strand:- start:1845 stop:2891 length:1047 start_codon:yes stop_codon:yes gene_type:complete
MIYSEEKNEGGVVVAVLISVIIGLAVGVGAGFIEQQLISRNDSSTSAQENAQTEKSIQVGSGESKEEPKTVGLPKDPLELIQEVAKRHKEAWPDVFHADMEMHTIEDRDNINVFNPELALQGEPQVTGEIYVTEQELFVIQEGGQAVKAAKSKSFLLMPAPYIALQNIESLFYPPSNVQNITQFTEASEGIINGEKATVVTIQRTIRGEVLMEDIGSLTTEQSGETTIQSIDSTTDFGESGIKMMTKVVIGQNPVRLHHVKQELLPAEGEQGNTILTEVLYAYKDNSLIPSGIGFDLGISFAINLFAELSEDEESSAPIEIPLPYLKLIGLQEGVPVPADIRASAIEQ